ncbi:MAG: lysylphosphatidylglycerol synthase transmembrane domain-containing protein [Chloroflexota bacterium]
MGRIEIALPVTTPPSRDWRRLLPGLLISLACLIVLALFVDWPQFWQALKLANYGLVAAALVLTLVWLGVRSVYWRTLLQEKASHLQVFFTVNEGYLLNNLLPFRLGELGRAFLLSRKASQPFFFVLSTIVLERTLDLILAVSLLMTTLPFVVGVPWARQASLTVGAITLTGLGVLYLAASRQQALQRLFERAQTRFPPLSRIGGHSLKAFLNGLNILMDSRRFLSALAWVTLNWLVAVLQYHLFLRAFYPQASLLWSAFCLGVIALGVAAPSSPSALGVLELSAVGALSAFQLDPSTSLAFAITVHLSQVLVTGLFGAYGLALEGESLFSLYHQLRLYQHQKPGDAS